VQGTFGVLLAIVLLTLAASRVGKRLSAAELAAAEPSVAVPSVAVPAAAGRRTWRHWAALWKPHCGLLAGLGVLAGVAFFWFWLEYQQSQHALAQLQVALWHALHPAHETRAAYGAPPHPLRPFRPPRLDGTYYRGNDVRHPALFNGGNYRTATLQLSLRDADGRKLEVGDEVGEKLVVRLELVRAANVSDAQFDDASLDQWFLSSDDLTEPDTPLPARRVPFVAVEPHQLWRADFPLAAKSDVPTSRSEGWIYVYRARAAAPDAGPPPVIQCQYGIGYLLSIADHRLTAESDLWMGSLYLNDVLALPQPRRVPLEEWFDDRPIPELPDGWPRDPFAGAGPPPFADFGPSEDDD
jgi:hypothetical protein